MGKSRRPLLRARDYQRKPGHARAEADATTTGDGKWLAHRRTVFQRRFASGEITRVFLQDKKRQPRTQHAFGIARGAAGDLGERGALLSARKKSLGIRLHRQPWGH